MVSGAKVAARHNRESKAENKDTFYLKKESTSTRATPQGPQTTTDVRFDAYNAGVTFTVVPAVKSETLMSFFFAYSESGVLPSEDKTAPPNTFSYQWESSVTAEPGKPIIAGAAQGRDTTTFLILTAAIQNTPAAQQ
ncbi:MAG: hypothetical protein LLF76_03485 [Planctomycetaceae bacterium]|nr:hypothetical protein [Planctomycetaceae bacterium]